MATNDEQLVRGGKKVIDLNIGYHSEEDCSYDSSGTECSTDSESDLIRDVTIENDNMLRNDHNSNESNDIFVDEPTVTTIEEPLVPPSMGMTFGSYEEVIGYYHEFGRQNGFQMKIRSRENAKGVDFENGNDCTRLRLACTKEGKFFSRGKDPSKAARTQKTGCKAKITASFNINANEWKLTTVVLEHNHPLDPLNSKFMSNYQFISPHNKEIIITNERAGVPISRNYATFAVRYGGFGAVPFSEKDCRNLVSKHRRLCLQKGDFAAMEKHFIEMSSKDKIFITWNAIKEVFPNSKHRWCIWHILRNAKKHLNPYEARDDIRKALRRALHDSLHIEEFEKNYGDMLEKYKLQDVKWFNDMYDLRHRWVPVYFKDDFWAGMSSTQRSESINNFFKAFVNLNTSLKEFVDQYSLALGKRANDEENETFRSINKPTMCFTEYVSESVFQRLYTSKKFEEFQDQVRLVTYTSTTKFQDDGRVCVYDVVTKKAKWPRRQNFKVTFDRDSYDVKCECKNFEFRGILCCHVVRVYHEEDVECVPEKYILSRWRKDMVRDYTTVPVPYYTPDKNPQAKRHSSLYREFEEIASLAIIDEKPYSFLMESLSKLKLEVKALGEGCQEAPQTVNTIGRVYGRHSSQGGGNEEEENRQHIDLGHQQKVNDPVDRRGKGKKPSKRKGYGNEHPFDIYKKNHHTSDYNIGYGEWSQDIRKKKIITYMLHAYENSI
ncbi:protein FAR1-RELATED SEQUENCE 1-like [Beta vulgaris subsp. vulgaris]|uniref:protein FAR1-RELATED SEQUENCE 1-like n=1 Tax=Beta vulgaris subsp. vulgaris TaxID=3555 RepID=UPI0025473314|nr:protein FAR1-RELATED SEQUENCE 1-like [Beta vulgaris subsp. vulgaris]